MKNLFIVIACIAFDFLILALPRAVIDEIQRHPRWLSGHVSQSEINTLIMGLLMFLLALVLMFASSVTLSIADRLTADVADENPLVKS